MSGLALAAIAITALLLVLAAALTLAARALNRVQRRDWAGTETDDTARAEDARVVVETAFNTLGLTREVLLILLVGQVVSEAIVHWPRTGWAVGIGVSLAAYLVLDKVVPHALVTFLGAQRVLSLGEPLLHPARWLLGPLARYLSVTTDRARDRLRNRVGDEDRGDLGAFLDLAEEEGMVTESEEALLRGVADFEEAVVREVMTPRVDIIAIDVGASLRDLRQLIALHRYSRIPVIRGDMDHVVGVANLRDLVAALEQSAEGAPIDEISRPVRFVPETKRVNELLQEFQQQQEQLAMVVDEYGGTAGLVTLEDLVEEIVGEIQDEDEPQRQLLEIQGDSVIASGKVEVEDAAEALGVSFPAGDFHTVGGLVFTHLGRVPEPGERFEFGVVRLEVLEADERRIHRVRLTSR